MIIDILLLAWGMCYVYLFCKAIYCAKKHNTVRVVEVQDSQGASYHVEVYKLDHWLTVSIFDSLDGAKQRADQLLTSFNEERQKSEQASYECSPKQSVVYNP